MERQNEKNTIFSAGKVNDKEHVERHLDLQFTRALVELSTIFPYILHEKRQSQKLPQQQKK